MQTIKFRGKSLNTEKWVYGDLRQSGKRKFIEYEVNPETVCQFIGIENEGIELYEHDLVECAGILCEIVYNDKIGAFVLLEVLTQNIGNKPIGQMIDMFGIKNIGNIYDNLELLKWVEYENERNN